VVRLFAVTSERFVHLFQDVEFLVGGQVSEEGEDVSRGPGPSRPTGVAGERPAAGTVCLMD
jgi:hypothetical protein